MSVLTEEDKEVKHIVEESERRLQAERARRREQPRAPQKHRVERRGRTSPEDTESCTHPLADSVEEVG